MFSCLLLSQFYKSSTITRWDHYFSCSNVPKYKKTGRSLSFSVIFFFILFQSQLKLYISYCFAYRPQEVLNFDWYKGMTRRHYSKLIYFLISIWIFSSKYTSIWGQTIFLCLLQKSGSTAKRDHEVSCTNVSSFCNRIHPIFMLKYAIYIYGKVDTAFNK